MADREMRHDASSRPDRVSRRRVTTTFRTGVGPRGVAVVDTAHRRVVATRRTGKAPAGMASAP